MKSCFPFNVHDFFIFHQIYNRTGASPGTFFTVSGTARMVPAEAPKMLIGSKRSVPVDKTLKVALLSILNNVEGNSAKSNVFGSSKSWKAIAVEYLIFQKLFGLCGFNRSFLILIWNSGALRTIKMSIEHVFTAYFHLALNEEPTKEEIQRIHWMFTVQRFSDKKIKGVLHLNNIS